MDRFVSEVRGSFDVMRIFAGRSVGQQHQLNRSLRAWFNYLGITGQVNEEYLDQLRKVIPKDQMEIDIEVPSEENVAHSLKVMSGSSPKYNVLYNLILDSGLRIVEAVQLFGILERVQKHEDFYLAPLNFFRRTKLAYYGFFTEHSMQLMKHVNEKLSDRNASSYLTKGLGKGVVT